MIFTFRNGVLNKIRFKRNRSILILLIFWLSIKKKERKKISSYFTFYIKNLEKKVKFCYTFNLI